MGKAAYSSLGSVTNDIKQTYNSNSGCDIVATLDGVLIGNLNGISFSTTREKAPIYVMGSVDAVSFGRGKRGHAGSLIFTNFDRHALYDIMQGDPNGVRTNKRYFYWKKQTDIPAGGRSKMLSKDLGKDMFSSLGLSLDAPNYSDQIPPFTITLTGMNEYGNINVMHILGVELINEGSGVSIDDIVTETQMTFVARAILGWTPVNIADSSSRSLTSSYYDTVLGKLNDLTAVQQAEDFATGTNVLR